MYRVKEITHVKTNQIMANVKEIFNFVQTLNPTESCISSLGRFTSDMDMQVSLDFAAKIKSYLPEGTLAKTIMDEMLEKAHIFYSSKQLWVISYELMKSQDFLSYYEDSMHEVRMREAIRKARKERRNSRTNA